LWSEQDKKLEPLYECTIKESGIFTNEQEKNPVTFTTMQFGWTREHGRTREHRGENTDEH
jgi:hypothetical protein